jgi:hypothetical protein
MKLTSLTKAMVVAVVCLSPLHAYADHHEPGQVENLVRQFYQQMATGEFEKAFSHMQLGARGYLPFGVLSEVRDEQSRQVVIAMYQKAHEEGARINLRPKYIKVTMHGDVALATYLIEGTVQESADEDRQRQLNRVSLIWTKTDSGWKIIHWHASQSEPADD